MKHLLLLPGLIALALFAGCNPRAPTQEVAATAADTPTHHDVAELAGKATGEVVAIGTLATLGSFSWDAAPLTTHAAAALRHIPYLVKVGKLSKEEGQAKIDEVDKAHDLIQKALKVCKQDQHTGKCKGSKVEADALLDQVRLALAKADQGLSEAEYRVVQ